MTRDYRETNVSVANDLATFLYNSPNAMDIVLFRPMPGTEETVGEGADVVGALESRERKVSYAVPVLTKGIIVPDESLVSAMSDDGESPVPGEEPIAMLILAPDVQKGAIVWFEEYVDAVNTEERYYYVMRSEAIGQSPAMIAKYYLMPLMDFTEIEEEAP
jgi:hypothetical protein